MVLSKPFCFDFAKDKSNDQKTKLLKVTTDRNHGAHSTAVTNSRNRKIRGLMGVFSLGDRH